MFGLFKKKESSFPVIDRIWMTRDAKERSLVRTIQQDTSVAFIHWFDESCNRSLNAVGEAASQNIFMVRDALHLPGQSRKFIFFEHYPVREKELAVYEKMGLRQAEIWTALDEPLLERFGGARLVEMMKKLGMNQEESIEHPLISRSIRKAQDKIAGQLLLDHHANSMESWFSQNLK
jgi:hypothetical protein